MFLVVVGVVLVDYSYRCFLSQFALLCDVVCDVAELLLDLPHRLEVGRAVEGVPAQQQQLLTTTTVVEEQGGGGDEEEGIGFWKGGGGFEVWKERWAHKRKAEKKLLGHRSNERQPSYRLSKHNNYRP
jgi:hypothetical protein